MASPRKRSCPAVRAVGESRTRQATEPYDRALEPTGTSAGSDRMPLRAIEINAALHCNLSCRGCSHASPIAATWFADPAVVASDLRALSQAATPAYVRVLGGEPLLHPDLRRLLAAIRGSGISGRLRVVTNATRLHLTPWEWIADVDEIHVSIYPGTAVKAAALHELEQRCRVAKTDLLIKRYFGFRLVHPDRPLDPEQAQAVFDTCQNVHAWGCHAVHEGALYMCPVTAPPYPPSEDGSLALEPAATLRTRLKTFLERPNPLSACTNCLGTAGALVPHKQVPKGHWQAASAQGVIDEPHLAALRSDPWANVECSSVLLNLDHGSEAGDRRPRIFPRRGDGAERRLLRRRAG